MYGIALVKWLIFFGCACILLGLILWGFLKWGVPLGQLSGDVKIEKEQVKFYFPIVTTLIISLVLTVIINVCIWLLKK